MSAANKTLVIRNGTLIDGSGKPSARCRPTCTLKTAKASR